MTKKEMKVLLLDKQQECCANIWCERPLDRSNTHMDHKMPVSRGGTEDLDNKQLLCGACNNRKSALTDDEFYHLEADTWGESSWAGGWFGELQIADPELQANRYPSLRRERGLC